MNIQRERSASLSKRGRENSEEKDPEQSIFTPNKKIIRSPQYSQQGNYTTGGMEKMANMLQNMFSELKREMITEMKNQTDEIRQIKEEMKRKEEKWDSEKTELIEKINNLERRIDRQEKEKRKNNTILSGIKLEETNMEQNLKEFINKELEIDIKPKKCQILKNKQNKNMYLVEWESFEDKLMVLKKKYKLKSKSQQIFIESDLTPEERKIQWEVRMVANEAKKQSQNVKIGYQKIFIDGEEYRWSEKEKGVVQVKDNKESKN